MSGSVETVLNTRIARLLRDMGLNAQPENRQPGSNRQIDVDADLGSWRVALEAEIDSRRGALADASKRAAEAAQGEVSADCVIAVNYPIGLTEADFTADTEIEWAVLPSETFTAGAVWQLAGVIRRARPEGSDPDRLAADLDNALALGVEALTANQRVDLARAVDAAWTEGNQNKTASAAKRALLVVAAAAMFHARLDAHLSASPPETDARDGTHPYQGPWPPEKLQHCVNAADPVARLDAAWDLILAVDYRPIFEAARRVLSEPAQTPTWSSTVKNDVQKALTAARDASSLRHDLMGRIFHRLLDTARYDGSFYTSSAAATLLAGLAIRSDDLPSDLSNYSVIDPACGTGTLLMAAAERIRDLRDPSAAEADAVMLIEDVITGLDVNVSACHMAATTLGLLSPSTAFANMKIRLMPLGVDEAGDTRVGSLELLTHKRSRPPLDLGVDWASGEHIDTGDKEEIAANSQRLVIMNPPYTRDSLRHDQFPQNIEKKIKAREKQLTSGRAGHGSSAGTMFMDLGEHLTAFSDGVIAFVYPSSGAAAPSNLEARKLLAEQFHIEWVVASHDPARLFFSENTNISEMLVVCRRHAEERPAKRPRTKFLVLRSNPSESTDAAGVVAAIENENLPASVGTITEWPSKLMAEGRWRPMGFTSAHLADLFTRIESGNLFTVERLGDAWDIGPAGRRIRDVFTKESVADPKGRRALWHNDTGVTQTMHASTDTYIHAKPGARHQRLSDRYWDQRSRLLTLHRPSWPTCRNHRWRPPAISVWGSTTARSRAPAMRMPMIGIV